MRYGISLACLCLLGTGVAGCAEDTVYPGFYGEPATSEQSITGSMSGGAAPPVAGAAAPLGGAGASGIAAGGTGGTGGMAGLPPIAGSGGEASAGIGGSSGTLAEAGGPAPGAPTGACDLSGRWLATMHYVTDAIGQLQTVHTYLYYEIAATADGFAITKGLHCGDDVIAEGIFPVTGDFSSSTDAVASRLSYAGRPVSSTETASGCDVSFAKYYVVFGATYPHYTDPSLPMPTIDQPASGGMPGWEDWDEDGQPGITIRLSGIVAGRVFVASRTWSSARGTVAQLGSRFTLPLEWSQEKNVIGIDGSELLASEAVRAADPSLHFVELARLDAAQATGDDLAICRAVVQLAPSLTPTAAGL
jgi:hypothetical protein